MSKTLLLFNNHKLSDLYLALLHGFFDTEVLIATSTKEAQNMLENHKIELIFVDFHLPQSQVLVKEILNHDQVIPIVLTADEEGISEAKKAFKTQTMLHYFRHTDEPEPLFRSINKMLDQQNRRKEIKQYCKVNLSFFFSTKEVFCDVYLKISEQKFVKVFNRYEKVDLNDLQKFERKHIKYLYVKDRDFSLITKKLVQSLAPMRSEGQGTDLIKNEGLSLLFSIQLQETVSETIQKIGLNEEALEMTSIAISNTMGLVEKSGEVYKILEKSIKRENYLSEHSFLLAYLSCAILKETPYKGQEASLALTLAAFFHDVTIEDPDVAKIQSSKERRFHNLGIQEQEEYLNHPLAAKDLVKKIEGIPIEVYNIIEHHHERYDGNGFPYGLNHRRLSPLCSIFNLSHELALYLFDSGNDPDHIKEIILDLENHYPLGHYAMAVKAAKKVFSIEMSKLKSA